MYKLEKILNNEEKKIYNKIKSEKKIIQGYKRMIMYGYLPDNGLRIAIETENNYNRNIKLFNKKIKSKLFQNIFLTNKENKYKKKFLNNIKSILYQDILNIIFSYYNESHYLYLVKLNKKHDCVIINNLNILKNLFYTNTIDKIYRVNSLKISKNPNSIINLHKYKLIYNHDLYLFSKIYFNNSIINHHRFSRNFISIKLFFYKKNIQNIKFEYINITNLNNLYIIKKFLKNKNLTKFEFYYINNIDFYDSHVKRILIDNEDINKSSFLNELYDHLIIFLFKKKY